VRDTRTVWPSIPSWTGDTGKGSTNAQRWPLVTYGYRRGPRHRRRLGRHTRRGRPAPGTTPYPIQRYRPDRLAPLSTGRHVTVAVIDSGVDASHPQLAGHVRRGLDLLHHQPRADRDTSGHGTAVAAIIAGRHVPGVAVQGLAPDATIVPIRVSERPEAAEPDPASAGSAATLAHAIRDATDLVSDHHGVINISATLDAGPDPAVADAVRYAADHDVVIVAAVGNRGDAQHGNPTPYPAAYRGVVGVAAIGPDGTRAPSSGHGTFVDIAAPGTAVPSAYPGGGYCVQDGTSFATPFVTATVALIRSRWPALSAPEAVRRLLGTADPAPGGPRSDGYGHGIVNPYRALTEDLPVGPSHPPQALAPVATDPAVAAGIHRRAGARSRAVFVAGAAAGGTILAGLLGAIVPGGVRRRWRPAGRVTAPPGRAS
jgi:membrane-anchored mycosin MYCP